MNLPLAADRTRRPALPKVTAMTDLAAPEHNNLGDALTELRALRADLARTNQPTRDLLADLAEHRRHLVGVRQQRDRLNRLWRQQVTQLADIQRALAAAGYESPTGRSVALIAELAAERDLLRLALQSAEVTA